MKTILQLIPICLALVATPTLAHSLDGQVFQKTDAAYRVVISSDLPNAPVAGTPREFEFRLFKNDSGQLVTFTDAVAQLQLNGKSVLESDLLYSQEGSANLTYAFLQEGTYTLHVSFHDMQGEGLAQSDIEIRIGGEHGDSAGLSSLGSGAPSVWVIEGFVVGMCIGAWWMWTLELRKRKSND